MYDILADLLNVPVDADPGIVSICGVIVVLVLVWFLDSVVKLFKIGF